MFNNYNITNIFFLNPSGYPYSFKLLFSYLYTQYVLILEEDWLIVKDIEQNIIISNFHIGYVYWKHKNTSKRNDYVFIHIGYKSTRKGMCRISLY